MKFEIETYKGQLIEYDDYSDKFVCDITIEDRNKSSKRASLSDVRKEIDQFVKANVDFKPFKVLSLSKYSKDDFEVLNVCAIRTDGKFVTHPEGNETSKSHAGKNEAQNWKVYDAEIAKTKKRLWEIKEDAVKLYRNQVKELISKLTQIELSKYEHIINPSD